MGRVIGEVEGQMGSTLVDLGRIVERAQARDEDAFRELYDLYARRVQDYLSRRLNGRIDDAEDLTADVFVKVFEKIGGYQRRGLPFSAWVFRIAHNHWIDYLRGRAGAIDVPLEAAVAVAAPTRDFDRRLTLDELEQALAELTDDQRRVVTLRFLNGYTVAETAARLDRSEDAVKKLQARGLIMLKRALDRDVEEDWR